MYCGCRKNKYRYSTLVSNIGAFCELCALLNTKLYITKIITPRKINCKNASFNIYFFLLICIYLIIKTCHLLQKYHNVEPQCEVSCHKTEHDFFSVSYVTCFFNCVCLYSKNAFFIPVSMLNNCFLTNTQFTLH